VLRLIDLDNLSGQGGPGLTGGEVFSMTAVGRAGPLPARGLGRSCRRGHLGLSQRPEGHGRPPARGDPVGQPQPYLEVERAGRHVTGCSQWRALRRAQFRSGRPRSRDGHVLWSDTGIGGVHWESPIVAHGCSMSRTTPAS